MIKKRSSLVEVLIRRPGHVSNNEFRQLEKSLNSQEKLRAQKIIRMDHRRANIICHGIKRQFISKKIGIPPQSLKFDYEPNGKPILCSFMPRQQHFSLSHKPELIAVAVTTSAPCGVDIERIRQVQRPDEFYKSVLSEQEFEYCFSSPKSEWGVRFTKLWVLKEALSKATGTGLNFSPSYLSFSISDNDSAAIELKSFNTKWSLFLRKLESYYLGVAVNVPDADLSLWVLDKTERSKPPT